jgi:hypothetical protein
MAAQTCAICGASVNLLQQQKLADGNYICRKNCAERVLKCFDLVAASLEEVQAHIKQVEEGTRIYNKLFKKSKLKTPSFNVKVAEELGLMALIEKRYKIFIFGKTIFACVYRIADLYGYELEKAGALTALASGKAPKQGSFVHYYFWDTPGMSDFFSELGTTSYKKNVEQYFDKLFGIQKTLGNLGKNMKSQFAAMKAVGSAVKAAATGGDVEGKASDAVVAMDRSVSGDRTVWIAKAEVALRGM